MSWFKSHSGPATTERRHTLAHTGGNHSPPSGRHDSVSSVNSGSLSPASTFSHGRQDSGASVSTIGSQISGTSTVTSTASATPSPGLKSFFHSTPEEKAAKKAKKEKKQKQVDQIVLTSKHAAAVRTKLQTDPQYASRRHSETPTAQVYTSILQVPHVPITKIPSAVQEMRFPHSGPPALLPTVDSHTKTAKGTDKDMPVLTRIVSGDEYDDDEDIERWQRAREEWVRLKSPDAAVSRRLTEGSYEEGGSFSTARSTTNSISRSASDASDALSKLELTNSPEQAEGVSSSTNSTAPPLESSIVKESVAEHELPQTEVTNTENVPIVAATVDFDDPDNEALRPKSKKHSYSHPLGVGWRRNEKGNWTR